MKSNPVKQHPLALRRVGLLLLTLMFTLAAPAAAQPAPAANVVARPAPSPARGPAIVALELPPNTDPAPAGVALAGETPLPEQRLADGAELAVLPGFAAPAANAPITLLRHGFARGRAFAVYAVASGGPGPAALASAVAPAARPITSAELADFTAAPFATGAPEPNPAAAGRAWTITVSAAGMQELSATALAAAGLAPGSYDPAALQLRHLGREVALEELRGPGGLEGLRFFAAPGDRWNAQSVYWLTLGTQPGLRMAERDATPAGAPMQETALERGEWRANTILETRLPGPAGDHFFSADLRTAPLNQGGTPATVTATIAPRLPLATGPAALSLDGGSLFERTHTLLVTLGATTRSATWAGMGTWTSRLDFPAGGDSAVVALQPAATLDGVHLQAVRWELAVRLDLSGQGARFATASGRAGYRMAGLPAGAALYDVSETERPVRLRFPGTTFEDVGPRDYLVAGPGTLHAPMVAAHAPVDLTRPLNVEALYIAPEAFLSALEPLLAHRRAQGRTVAAVSIEAIYASWGYGQLNPAAIRSFLRYAAERWQVAPTTVVLVGDGSSDPRNYLGRNNRTWVPPYLAMADPWIGETACDSCYVRLHGDDPLQDPAPDLRFGRIPAKSVAELQGLVAKLLAYETSAAPGLWRATLALIADNPDLGGNFPAQAEATATAQPTGMRFNRVYYDPDATADEPHRTADPSLALARSMAAFDGGAAIVQYVGHGLQFQWGYTGSPLRPGEPTDRQHLLGLFGVDELRNGPRQPVVLAMTCLTGSFQIPAFSGTSIDERLVARTDGGAIAAWSSTGLGLNRGHDALQRGFYRALWAQPGRATLGELTMAGFSELIATAGCCQESVSTFVLLGDPLTVPRVDPNTQALTLPLVRR